MADDFLVLDAQRAALAENRLDFGRNAQGVELPTQFRAEAVHVLTVLRGDEPTAECRCGNERDHLRDAHAQGAVREVELLPRQTDQRRNSLSLGSQDEAAPRTKLELAGTDQLASQRMDGDAVLRMQFGTNMSKFSGMPLPGGVTINADKIIETAERNLEKIEKEIRDVFEEPPEMICG